MSLVAMGAITAVATQVVPALRRSSTDAASVRQLDDAEAALLAFSAAHGRLPCPDTNADGFEDTGSCGAVGGVPYATLGFSAPVVNAVGLPFKYGVYLNPGTTLRTNANLSRSMERYRPSTGGDPGSIGDVGLVDQAIASSNRRLDFCQALRAGMSAGVNTQYLYIENHGLVSTRKNVPYVLVDPGTGNMDLLDDQFDGYNAGATNAAPRFETPTRSRGLLYDDRVIVGYFDQMWERLGCSANMATAGRALPNVETTAALLKQSLKDYKDQLELASDLAYANNFSAGADIAGATADLAAAASDVSNNTSKVITTAGAAAAALTAAVSSVVLSTAALALAIANQVFTVQMYDGAKQDVRDMGTLVDTKFNPMYADIKANVQKAGERVYSNK